MKQGTILVKRGTIGTHQKKVKNKGTGQVRDPEKLRKPEYTDYRYYYQPRFHGTTK
jgi:hypothetical protein